MLACGYCEATFEFENERAFHWYCRHMAEISWEEADEASREYVRRWEHHEQEVDVQVTFPADTWEFIVRAYGPADADPREVEPADIPDDYLIELPDLNYEFHVEKPVQTDGYNGPSTRCPSCEDWFTFDEALSITFNGTDARWQCPDCGELTHGPAPSPRSGSADEEVAR